MTLPFRRRHHDGEGAHDRARALTSREMLEPIGDDDATWLTGHLADCAECRQDRDAYIGDRELLRALRERTPEPPRDLWARTSAALDREAGARRGRGSAAPGRRPASDGTRRSAAPFGAAAGALVVLIVIGAAILPPLTPPTGPDGTPRGSQTAVGTPEPQPTTFSVSPSRLGWLQAADNGTWELILTDVDAVCPRARPTCQPLIEEESARTINLGSAPTGVTISPTEESLVVEARAQSSTPDRIFVVPVPPIGPVGTPGPVVTQGPAETPTPPGTDAAPTTELTPGPSPTSPDGAIEIASGVSVVGEAAYSADGRWLAFSARPSDGSAGPDLYLWARGMASAMQVTADRSTYFSSWLDGQVIASSVAATDVPAVVDPSGAPSAQPTVPVEVPSDAPSADPEPVEAHPISFLLDPDTLARTDIGQRDVWLPVVDPTGRFVAFWSGTVVSNVEGTDWRLGTGELVLDGWSNGLDTAGVGLPGQATHTPSDDPSGDPSGEPSGDPGATAAPGTRLGPAGSPVAVVTGPTAAFKAKFDPTGGRLAIWAGEEVDATVGRLHLIVLDPVTGVIDLGQKPLPGAPALRRFSIDEGRLAWVSPSGQDGQESSVQVLGWSKDEFGEIRTVPAKDLFIVR